MNSFRPLGLTNATKVALSVTLMVFLLVAGLGVEYWMISNTIARSNSQWCDTLALLTGRPVPKPADPKANPSRQATYELFEDFVNLKSKFGCHG